MNESHFLRPDFSSLVINRLHRGQSLNLFGSPGIGKSRLLEDIEKAAIPDTRMIHVSFKGYQYSYQGFCVKASKTYFS